MFRSVLLRSSHSNSGTFFKTESHSRSRRGISVRPAHATSARLLHISSQRDFHINPAKKVNSSPKHAFNEKSQAHPPLCGFSPFSSFSLFFLSG